MKRQVSWRRGLEDYADLLFRLASPRLAFQNHLDSIQSLDYMILRHNQKNDGLSTNCRGAIFLKIKNSQSPRYLLVLGFGIS